VTEGLIELSICAILCLFDCSDRQHPAIGLKNLSRF